MLMYSNIYTYIYGCGKNVRNPKNRCTLHLMWWGHIRPNNVGCGMRCSSRYHINATFDASSTISNALFIHIYISYNEIQNLSIYAKFTRFNSEFRVLMMNTEYIISMCICINMQVSLSVSFQTRNFGFISFSPFDANFALKFFAIHSVELASRMSFSKISHHLLSVCNSVFIQKIN